MPAVSPSRTRPSPLTVESVLRVVGALSGFAVLVYVVGAVTMWLRFKTTGFDADLALTAVSRSRLVFLGFRVLVLWTIVVSLGILVLVAIARVGRVPRRLPHPGAVAVVASAAAIVASALVTWGLFTVVCVVVASAWFVRWYRDWLTRAHPGTRWPLVAFVAVTATLASIGWQLQIQLPYDHAHLTTVSGPRRSFDAIYFGELNGDLYVSPRFPPPSHAFDRNVSVIPKAQVTSLVLFHSPQTLCPHVPPPAHALGSLLDGIGRQLGQHLRNTGKPYAGPKPKPTPPLARGQCPHL